MYDPPVVDNLLKMWTIRDQAVTSGVDKTFVLSTLGVILSRYNHLYELWAIRSFEVITFLCLSVRELKI